MQSLLSHWSSKLKRASTLHLWVLSESKLCVFWSVLHKCISSVPVYLCALCIYLLDLVLPHLPCKHILSEFPVLNQLISVGVYTVCHLSDCLGCFLALSVLASEVVVTRYLPAFLLPTLCLNNKQVKSLLTSAVQPATFGSNACPGLLQRKYWTTGTAANLVLCEAGTFI